MFKDDENNKIKKKSNYSQAIKVILEYITFFQEMLVIVIVHNPKQVNKFYRITAIKQIKDMELAKIFL
jgi:hypothetical protein